MNKSTTIKAEKVVDVDIAEVKSLIFDLSKYPKWWNKFSLKLDRMYETISFKPLSFIKIKLKIIDKGECFIKFQYIEGPFNGFGIWELKELENRKTHVSYTITISGTNKLINLIISTPFFKLKHINDINKLIILINKQ